MRRSARKGPLSAVAAGLSRAGITRISADFAAGVYVFVGLIFLALPGPVPWVGVIICLLLVGPVGAALAFFGASAALKAIAAAARWGAAAVPGLSRKGLVAIAGAAAAFAIATGALLVADAGTFLARALAFALPAMLVAACGLWTCALAFRTSRRPGRRWLARVPDAVAIATAGAVLLVLADRELLTAQLAAVLLFPVAVTASIRGWIAMKDSARLAVRAAADITLSLLLGAELVLFLVWLANVLGMSRAEVARLRSALQATGSYAGALLDWRIWVGAYLVLALATAAFVAWPAPLRAVTKWLDRLRVASLVTGAQRILTGLNIGLLAIVLLAAAGPAAVAPILQRQLHATYVVALQRQFEADGEVAAYTAISRAFAPRVIAFPILADIVREVHDTDSPAPGQHHATSAEADLARRLGELQAVAMALPRPPSLDPAAQSAASDAGFGGPVRDASDLSHRAAATEAEEAKGDAASKRVELAAELAAKAVANTISIPQVSSNEVVQVVTEYLSGLIEDSPLKTVFAAWLEHLPRGKQPPDAETLVVPNPVGLALAAEEQMITEARADGVIPPLTDPFADGASDTASVKAAVDLTTQTSEIQHHGTCSGCIRVTNPHDEPPVEEHPFER